HPKRSRVDDDVKAFGVVGVPADLQPRIVTLQPLDKRTGSFGVNVKKAKCGDTGLGQRGRNRRARSAVSDDQCSRTGRTATLADHPANKAFSVEHVSEQRTIVAEQDGVTGSRYPRG